MTETTVALRKSEWTPPANTLWDMSDEQRKARPATQYGPTAGTVAENVQRLRKRRELSIYQLSALLRKAGRAITPAAVGKIERQQRQVTVDDLMALATVLGASPQALLLPLRDDPAETIELTGAGTVPADAAWVWMPPAEQPLRMPAGIDPNTALLEFVLANWPPNAYRRMRDVLLGRLDALAYEDADGARRRDSARRLAASRQDPPIGEFVMRDEGEGDTDGPGMD